MNDQKVLLLEFNELCPSLMDRFIKAGKLPNFKRLYQESTVAVTNAEEEQEHLEPWIQWITAHTGMSFAEHGIYDLGDGHKLKEKSIWDLISDTGRKVFVCGSMNAHYNKPFNGYIIPDAWATDPPPYPEELTAFTKFVQTNVQEHTNEKVPLSKKDYLNFLSFMAKHGLSIGTLVAIARQILSQKITKKGHWKKAVLLDKIQWDLFQWYYRKKSPQFSTFFLNSTAHYQHKYWRFLEPEKFALKSSKEDIEEYKDSILFGYTEMDKIVGKVLNTVDKDTTVILCSALSQQAYTAGDSEGGKTFYRPKSFQNFVDFAELQNVQEVAPVMSEEFHVYFDDEASAEQGCKILNSLTVNNTQAFKVRRDGTNVFAGCSVHSTLEDDVILKIPSSGKETSFYSLFYRADCIKSGMHHPDGIFWISSPERKHSLQEDKIPLRAVAPTILDIFNTEVPSYMKAKSSIGRQAA